MSKQSEANQRLSDVCSLAMAAKGLPQEYAARLKDEMREIDAQNEAAYFLDLLDRKVRYPKNENNLLVPWLLGIVEDFDINTSPVYTYGEFPDIDMDYIDVVRDYLKNEWAPKEFGADRVCSIGTYTKFKLKGTFQDMARVHGESHSEITDLTTKLGLKDDEGHVLEFDKALDLYPDLKAYCEKYGPLAKAVKKLAYRNRGMGKHAGGLIIARESIAKFVPLVKNPDDGTVSSAWVEGMNAQDLGPVGLIKFDLLVINDLKRLAIASNYAKRRHNLPGMCALPGRDDWTDRSYLNDPVSIEMAGKGDLLGIFQFDSEGIRSMVRRGGVDSYHDMVAYNALYRPGPMLAKLHDLYIERKKGSRYEIHPTLEPILGGTYGVLCYQEQIMKVLNVAGEIPLKDCYVVIKAIAKKKLKLFEPYKDQFIANASKNLGISLAMAAEFWGQIENFSEYAFNKSHAVAYVYLAMRLLKIKAHWPLEFYAATLHCESDAAKMKEYKIDAENHGVTVLPLDLNKSKENFDIVDDKIYFGFGNVKGIGEGVAKRIVSHQPYAGFQDFLERFGTDAKVVRALIGLRVFNEADPVTLYKYYEFFKDKRGRIKERKKRCVDRFRELHERLKELLGPELEDKAVFDDALLGQWKALFDKNETIEVETEEEETIASVEGMEPIKIVKKVFVRKKFNRYKEIEKTFNAYARKVEDDRVKSAAEASGAASLANFNPDEHTLDDDIVKEMRDAKECERLYYGFNWRSRLEESPDYTGGHTFERFRVEAEAGCSVFSVEVEVEEVHRKQSKKNKDFYFHQLVVSDANGEVGRITVWEDDWERWGPEMKKGNLLKIRLLPPSGGFKGYTFESPPRHQRWKLPKDKRQDNRLFVMEPPVQAQPQWTEKEIMADLDKLME